jgi:hypothetical protein
MHAYDSFPSGSWDRRPDWDAERSHAPNAIVCGLTLIGSAGLILTCGFGISDPASAAPAIADPSFGTLELVTPAAMQSHLGMVDGLEIDANGNLVAALEQAGAAGGMVYVDKITGSVTQLVSGIGGSDQILREANGDLLLTSELTPAATSSRLYRITVSIDGSNVPTAATATSVATTLGLSKPEGIAILPADGPYGSAGDLYLCEDRTAGDVIHFIGVGGAPTVIATNLATPEGLAFGDFGGQVPAAVYVGAKAANQVQRIGPDGTVTVLGDPAGFGLARPDNVEFGPDGFLYVSEDVSQGRIVRIAADGTHEAVVTGLNHPQGMVFDTNGDLYIAEQAGSNVWRIRFPPMSVTKTTFSAFKILYRPSSVTKTRGVAASPGAGVIFPRTLRPAFDLSGRTWRLQAERRTAAPSLAASSNPGDPRRTAAPERSGTGG